MKYYLLLMLCLCLVSSSFAQKVDNKKGITYIDDKPVLKINGGSLVTDNLPTQILGYESGKLLFVITKHYYTKNGNRGYWYNEVRFADYELSFKNSYDYKPLIKSLYENGALNAKGELNREAVEKYIRLYGQDLPEWYN